MYWGAVFFATRRGGVLVERLCYRYFCWSVSETGTEIQENKLLRSNC